MHVSGGGVWASMQTISLAGLEQVRAALVQRQQETVQMLAQESGESAEMCLVIDEKAALLTAYCAQHTTCCETTMRTA